MKISSMIEAAVAASGAHFGVHVHHLESGEQVAINANEPFPLCSVVKTPILVEALAQAEAGRLDLDERWELTAAEKNLPSGVLVFLADGLRPTLRDLLTLMMIISDNTATDMVLRRITAGAVNARLREHGINNTHVVTGIRDIFDAMLPDADPTPYLAALKSATPRSPQLRREGRAFSRGPDNNVGTARDMNRLLELIFRGEIASRAVCDQAIVIMLQQQLNERLPRFLPPGTPFAHKTGTLSGLRNDSGILYLGEAGHAAITAFAAWDDEAVAANRAAFWERTVAIDSTFGRIGLLVYEHYRGML